MADDPLAALREALRLSPNNIPLRQHLADSLLQSGRADEAEKEFREALSLAPNSFALKLGLARAYFRLGKNSHALVIAEDLVKNPGAPAAAFILHARLLAGIGEVQQAISEYRRGVEIDPNAADAEFAARWGSMRAKRIRTLKSWKVKCARVGAGMMMMNRKGHRRLRLNVPRCRS